MQYTLPASLACSLVGKRTIRAFSRRRRLDSLSHPPYPPACRVLSLPLSLSSLTLRYLPACLSLSLCCIARRTRYLSSRGASVLVISRGLLSDCKHTQAGRPGKGRKAGKSQIYRLHLLLSFPSRDYCSRALKRTLVFTPSSLISPQVPIKKSDADARLACRLRASRPAQQQMRT